MTLLHIIAEANLSQQARVIPSRGAAFMIAKPILSCGPAQRYAFHAKIVVQFRFYRTREDSNDVELAVCGDFRRKR
jgi:hypothetical protein